MGTYEGPIWMSHCGLWDSLVVSRVKERRGQTSHLQGLLRCSRIEEGLGRKGLNMERLVWKQLQ